jgi:hypothetical protein
MANHVPLLTDDLNWKVAIVRLNLGDCKKFLKEVQCDNMLQNMVLFSIIRSTE